MVLKGNEEEFNSVARNKKQLVTTIKEKCRVCYTCVRECPAKAIKIVNGQAEIIQERCIGCGNCVKVCPIHLVPSVLAKYIDKEFFDEADEWNVLDCMECGSCAYACPSRINLVHFMKLGKYQVMAARKAAAEKQV